MEKIPLEVAIAVEKAVPEIVDTVQMSKSGTILMRIDGFNDDAQLFYNTVWYNLSCGMRVEVAAYFPDKNGDRKPKRI